MNFEEFDPEIGVDEYCHRIHSFLFPNSTSKNVDAAKLDLTYRIYPKGSVFSRVRPIREAEVNKYSSGLVTLKDFLPPTRSVTQIPIGRFNNQGERKLYLADHPFVAIRECDIKPNTYFLISCFSLKMDMRFIEVNSNGSAFCKLLNKLFQSKDQRFYQVINRVYERYLNYDCFQGIAYESVKVHTGYRDQVWGEVKSTTNLAMTEGNISSAKLVTGWLAQCGANHSIKLQRIFKPLNPKKKNKLTSYLHQENKSKFISEHKQAMNDINNLTRKSELSIQKGKFINDAQYPIKFNLKD